MDQQQQSRRRPTKRQLLWAVGIAAVLTVAVLIGYRYGITLWDWIKLLIVPAVIAGGGLWFNMQQRDREQRIASERAQDEALQAYLEGMSQLLTDRDRPLHRAPQGDSLRTVARARTLTALKRLDAEHKNSILDFLRDSQLIDGRKGPPILSFSEVDFRGVDLSKTKLQGAVLRKANLQGANLQEANLWKADLTRADLSGYIHIHWMFIEVAKVAAAHCEWANLDQACLNYAHLRNTYLQHAKLSNAELKEADLREARLEEADLTGADLSGADLNGAQGVTQQRLVQAKSLVGATMPNGQKYEEWFKDREGRKEDG